MTRLLVRSTLAACCLALPVLAAAQQADTRIAYFFSDGRMPVTLDAYKSLLEERPDLRGRVEISFVTESTFDGVDPGEIAAADVLVFDTMNEQMLERFDGEHGMDLLARVAEDGDVIGVGEGLMPKETYLERGVLWEDLPRALWRESGAQNQIGLLKYALTRAGVDGLALPEPEPSLDDGYYYPDGAGGALFSTWRAFDAWRAEHGKRVPGAPRIAIGFFKSSYYAADTRVIDALVREIERQGAEAIPVFGYPAAQAFERLLLDADGEPRADVALAFLFRFADFESSRRLEKLDIPVLNAVTLYGRTQQQWRESATGLSMFEGTFHVAVPELAGLVAPTVVGSREKLLDLETGLSVVQSRPVDSRLPMAVRRALRYAALSRKPNEDKRIALMYYNFPPGKANISASYLNVAGSLSNVLHRLGREGYDVGDRDLSADAILDAISTQARNVAGHAPGELEAMLAEGEAARIPVERYARWLDDLAPPLRAEIVEDWGEPEDFELMTDTGPGERALVVPLVRYGNVVLMPQPARGWGEDAEQLYHAEDLAPHHQYVAAYEWLRRGFEADAVVHVGTHGTLEWLDGKEVGQTRADPSDALIAELPDIYIYNVDVVGEGLVARRRGLATLVDHMVPPFTAAGLYPELAELGERLADYDTNLHKNPELAAAYADDVRELVVELGIAKDLGLDLSGGGRIEDAVVHRIQRHLLDLKEEHVPYGLHTFGKAPEGAARASTVEAVVSTDRSLMPGEREVLAADMEQRIVASARRELDNLVRALDGGFVPGGTGGEPIRNPDAYPTGKNFYGIDPEKVPKPAAWELGVELADRMLADHVEENGRYPEKVSFVIWGDETMRHEGVLESQIFHLLGTRPVWDARGKVVGVEVVPRRELGRPRVDIVISSAAEGMFNNVTLLMDEAVQKVKVLDEAENYVRRHYLQTRARLVELGYPEDEADRRAGVRIFDEPPGTYDLNTSNIVAASGTWETDRGIGDDYLRKMGHGFGNGYWGEPMEDVFRMALSGTEKVVHSSSTMLYGALDNDDFFMYMGGLASAIRNLDGETPELVVTSTRDPADPEMASIDEFIGEEFRTRYVNPTWIEGMQKEGYAGAAHIREFVEYLWGWDATVTETVDDSMWRETFEVYVEDKHGLDMKSFFEDASPFAYQDITARMIETVRKDYWRAADETLATLVREYLDSVDAHGISCTEVSCGNPQLLEYVIEQAAEARVPAPLVEAFREAVERATGAPIEQRAAAAAEFVAENEARIASRRAPGPETLGEQTLESAELQGYLMRSVEEPQAAEAQSRTRRGVEPEPAASRELGLLWLGLGVVGVLGLWRWRHARAR